MSRRHGNQRECDYCGVLAPTLALPEDWHLVLGDDFCAECFDRELEAGDEMERRALEMDTSEEDD